MIRKVLLVLLLLSALALVYYNFPLLKGLFKDNVPKTSDITELIPFVSSTPVPGQNATDLPLNIPDGYKTTIYAKDLVNPRDLALDAAGTLLASLTSQGKVVAIAGSNTSEVVSGLNQPHGLAFSGNKLFVAETDNVSVFDYDPKTKKATNKKKIIDLPGGGGHFTRSLLIKDNKLFVSIGSTCNVCKENDERRAAIWSANLDGSDFKPFATGLRNSVFMELNPKTNEIWATEMGRDNLGDDTPPDEVNIIKEAKFYGWPYCWGDGVNDKDLNSTGSTFDCSGSVKPLYKLQAHSAPLGLAFLDGDLLVAFHGSWNRSVPTGYKVVRIKNGTQKDFVSGWLTPAGEVLGRPADILVKGNQIFISDDKAGVIYLLEPIR